MKRLLVLIASLHLSTFSIGFADEYAISAHVSGGANTLTIYRHNVTAGTTEVLRNDRTISGISSSSFVDTTKGYLYLQKGSSKGMLIYDYVNDAYIADTSDYSYLGTRYVIPYSDKSGEDIITVGTDSEDSSATTILGSLDISDSSGTTLIEQNTNGNTIKIGEDASGETGLIISNTAAALDIQDGAGNTMIKVTSDGATHIGENSLVTQEVNGRQDLYATDANGNQIDLNIKSGTNLLIDGVNILDSIGADISGSSAMSAALAALPNASPDAAYTCGLGTGLHDSSSALAAGCAADFANFAFVDNLPKIFERASFNIGSSFLMNGEPDLSEARDTSIKAGITFKFGAPKKIRTADITQLRTENKIDAVMLQNKKVMNENAILKKQLANNSKKSQLLEDQIAAINLKLETLNMVASN